MIKVNCDKLYRLRLGILIRATFSRRYTMIFLFSNKCQFPSEQQFVDKIRKVDRKLEKRRE